MFQAICRVNRLDGEDKEYGYVIDYKDLFNRLEGAISDYTSGAFDKFEASDVAGLLTDRLGKGQERLENTREAIKALCEPVLQPKGQKEADYFCGDVADKEASKNNEPKRVALYKVVASLVRAYANLANEMEEAGYTQAQIAEIKKEVEHYVKVKEEVKMRSGDYLDMKQYEPAMRHLLDTYIRADATSRIRSICAIGFDDGDFVCLAMCDFISMPPARSVGAIRAFGRLRPARRRRAAAHQDDQRPRAAGPARGAVEGSRRGPAHRRH